jgi:hypothetical protein
MGTNFYLADGTHIGKRSGAGVYCRTCETTLCEGGPDAIHYGKHDWFPSCPHCGMMADKLPTVCSFTWAIEPLKLLGKPFMVRDEYGAWSKSETFVQMLNNCPIHFYDMIGNRFS